MNAPKTTNGETKKPLTLWEKIKSGVKGFVRTALDYAPRGVMFVSLLFGASALAGVVAPGSGWDIFHVVSGGPNGAGASAIDLLTHLGRTLLIGGAISGAVGAYQEVSQTTRLREAEIALERVQNERQALLVRGQQRETNRGAPDDEVRPQRDLPMNQSKPNLQPGLS